MKKILVLGGSSYVGRHLIKKIRKEDVIYTYNNSAITGGVKFDSTIMNIEDCVDLGDVRCAVILLGDTDPESCTSNIVKSEELNVNSIERIINVLAKKNIKVVFASSEFVYDGNSENYKESDDASPILLYGRQKLKIEHYIEEHIKNYVILRFAKIYGTDLGDGTLFSSWMKIIDKGADIVCADDQYFSPVHIYNVIETIIFSINQEIQGTFNLAGPVRKSRKDLLMILLDEAQKIKGHNVSVVPCSIDDFELNEKRPKDVSMNPSKLIAATGIKLVSPEESCRNIVKRYYSQ